MIGMLPTTLSVNGVDYAIRSDYRVMLTIFEAYGDISLTDSDKITVMLQCLYVDVPQDITQAAEQAVWFIDGGGTGGSNSRPQSNIKVIDWVQDEQLIFAAVNKVAGREIRALDYLHWWTFLGYFNEVGEGLLSTVINIRCKKAKGKKLEKYEQEFYKEHRDLIDLKKQYTEAEKQEMAKLNAIFR